MDWTHGYRQDGRGGLLFFLAVLMVAAFSIHAAAPLLWLLRGAAALGFGLNLVLTIRAEHRHAQHPSDEEIQILTR